VRGCCRCAERPRNTKLHPENSETWIVMSHSFLFDAGWVFFTTWSVILLVVSVAAFGRDLFPREHADSRRNLGAVHKR
jgi:hypothetical protein